MIFRPLLIILITLLSWTSVYADLNLMSLTNESKIQKILDNWRARSAIPGAVLSIYTPEQTTPLTFASGTSEFRGGKTITKNTLFQAGSITKSFTSMVILKLEAEGKLNIEDPITRYLPQYPKWQNVTIRQILNHTSGIANYTNTGQFNRIRKLTPQAGFTPEQLVSMAGSRMLFAPGKGWKYSNTNYVLAGMIIEKVTGTPVNQIMNRYIHSNNEVDLLNTYYFTGLYNQSYLSRMAHGYNTSGEDVTGHDISWAFTAGAIVTTSEDLLAWWYDLLQGNILPKPQMQKLMSLVCEGRTPNCRSGQPISHIKSGEVGYGYGLGVIQMSSGSSTIGPVWWHNGSTAGYKAIVMWFPKLNVYMALTINRDPGYLLKPSAPIIRNVLAVLLPQTKPTLTQAVRHVVTKKVKVISTKVRHLTHHHKAKAKPKIKTKSKAKSKPKKHPH